MTTKFQYKENNVRLFYDKNLYPKAEEKFYDFMYNEGSPIYQGFGSVSGIQNIPDVFYWQGAVLTYGPTKDGEMIEIHKDGPKNNLDRLVLSLENKMEVKFKKQKCLHK